MKKILLFVLVVILALSMVACSTPAAQSEEPATSSEAAAPTQAAEASQAPEESKAVEETASAAAATDKVVNVTKVVMEGDFSKYTIALVPKCTGLAWFQRKEVGVKQFAEDTGVDSFMIGPAEADAALQAQTVEDLIAQGVDAITIIPVSTEALEPVLKKAREAGIVVITHEGEGMQNIDYDLEAFVNEDYGEHFMKKLGDLMGGTGEYIVEVGSLTAASHNQWVDSSINYQKANFPEMSLYGDKLESGEDQEQSYEKVKEVLKANPNIKGFQGSGMSDVGGAALAVEEAGMSGKVSLVGTSLVSVAGKFVRNGTISMISFWDPAIAGYAMQEIALMVLEGKEITDGVDLGLEGYEKCSLTGNVLKGQAWIDVTADNVDDPAYAY